jgi:hypothetical protein
MTADLYRDHESSTSWLMFAGKPDSSTIGLLKANGWRWGSYRQGWYKRGHAPVPAGIEYVDQGACDFSAERADRLQERSKKKAQEGQTLIERSHQMGEIIPLGQPILEGHYSEGRDRRYRDRIRKMFEKGYEAAKESETLQRQAQGSARNQASKHQPDAIARRIERLIKDLKNCVNYERAEYLRGEIARLQAELDTLGGTPWDRLNVQVGDIVKTAHGTREVLKINRKTITADRGYGLGLFKIPFTDVIDIVKRAEQKEGNQ